MLPTCDEIIKAFFCVCVEGAAWDDAFSLLLRAFNSPSGVTWSREGRRTINIPYSKHLPADYITRYELDWSLIDPTPGHMLAHPGKCVVSDSFVTDEERDRNPYLREHVRMTGMTYRMASHGPLIPCLNGGMTVHRPRNCGEYSSEEMSQFESLFPYLQQALVYGIQLETLKARQACAQKMLDGGSSGIVLLDQNGIVCDSNGRAIEISGQDDGLKLLGGRVVLSHPVDNQLFQTEVQCALRHRDAYLGTVLKARRRSQLLPYAISVRPAPRSRAIFTSSQPAVYILITETDSDYGLEPRHLMPVFDFTHREAQLVALLVAGQSLKSAADRLGLHHNSAATSLHTGIFQKTRTRSQGQLIARVLKTMSSLAVAPTASQPPSNQQNGHTPIVQ